MGYDLNAVLTLEEKQKFFKLASDNKWILFFYHDPETVAVTIKEKNGNPKDLTIDVRIELEKLREKLIEILNLVDEKQKLRELDN